MPEHGSASVLDRDAFAEEVAKQLSRAEEERARNKYRQRARVRKGGSIKPHAAKPAGKTGAAGRKPAAFKVHPDRIFHASGAVAYEWAQAALKQVLGRMVGDGTVFVLRNIDERTTEAVRAVIQRLPELVQVWDRARSEERIERLIADLLPEDGGRSGHVEIDNAIARTGFVGEHRSLTSTEVHAISGSSSSNKSIPATRWRTEGRIFSVPFRGRDLFPAFQFKDGQPRPVVAKLLALMPSSMTDWEKAFWFVSNNGWIEGAARPVDRLDDEDAVLAAAAVLREPNIG